MDALTTRIKNKVLAFYPTILADLAISDAYLTLVVEDVIDRALVYMNRNQLVYYYELDLVNYPQGNAIWNEFWACYDYPVPAVLEGVLAKTVVGAAKTLITQNTATRGSVERIKDGQQEIQFGDKLTQFLTSGSEADVFSGSLALLQRYLLPTVVKG